MVVDREGFGLLTEVMTANHETPVKFLSKITDF